MDEISVKFAKVINNTFGVESGPSVIVNNDLQWKVSFRGKEIDTMKLNTLSLMPSTLSSFKSLKEIIDILDVCVICEGNGDDRYLKLSLARKKCFWDISGKYQSMNKQASLHFTFRQKSDWL
jgi:hypothetical protein